MDSRDVNKSSLLATLGDKKTYMEKTGDRKRIEKLEKDTAKVLKWLEDSELTTVQKLASTSNLSRLEIERVMVHSPEVREIMNERRRMITGIAADNMLEIVMDRKDPNNYQATKFVLENFKNELDDTVVSKTNIEASFGPDEQGNISPIKITFSSKQ